MAYLGEFGTLPGMMRSRAARGEPVYLRLRYTDLRSDKFYEITGRCPGGDEYEVLLRWGRVGTTGQGKAVTLEHGIEKLTEKLASGYRIETGGSESQQEAASFDASRLARLAAGATQYPATVDKLAAMAITHEWTNQPAPPAEVCAVFRDAESVRLFRAGTDGARWVVVRYADGSRTVGRLGV